MSTVLIDEALDEGRYADARLLIEKELEIMPKDHWLLTMLSVTHYEEFNYGLAVEITENLAEDWPNCPLVAWHHAGSLDAVGRSDEAIEIYQSMIELGAENIAKGECGEEHDAKSLVNDCLYRLALVYMDKGLGCEYPSNEYKENMRLACQWLEKHIEGRKTITSIYTEDEVKENMSLIEFNRPPKPEPPRNVVLREDKDPIYERYQNPDGTTGEYCHPEKVKQAKHRIFIGFCVVVIAYVVLIHLYFFL